MTSRSGASAWPVLRPFIDAEARIAARMSRRPATAALYEFLRFGMKQAWACLFGGLMLALLLSTYFLYPQDAETVEAVIAAQLRKHHVESEVLFPADREAASKIVPTENVAGDV